MMDIRTDAKNLDDRSLEYIHSLGCYFKPDEVFIRPRQTVTFDSPLSLFVIKYLATGNAQVVGRTPGDNPVAFNLDPGDSWTLYAPGLVSSDLGQLVMDINDHSVPSLILNRGELVQSDLVQLAGAPTLTTLGLGTDWTSLAGIQELTQLVTLIIDNNHRITDTELSLLTGLASLEELMLTSSSNISNAGMPHLAALAGLKRLYLNRTSVDDVGIATLLSGAPSMTGLHMEQLGVTDNTVAQVISRPSMVELDFDETHISDSGAAQLGALTSLKVLDLRDNKGGLIQNATLLSLTNALPSLRSFSITSQDIDDAGMANIGNLTQMEELTLHGHGLTDMGLAGIGALSMMTTLSLRKTELTDSGLSSFVPLTGMWELFAENTQVTPAGKAYLEAQIPGLTVYI